MFGLYVMRYILGKVVHRLRWNSDGIAVEQYYLNCKLCKNRLNSINFWKLNKTVIIISYLCVKSRNALHNVK